MKIGIEAQRIFRKKKHGMDMVALELIRNLQQIDKENEYYVFVKPDEDNTVLQETPNFKIIELKGGAYPWWEQVALPAAAAKYGCQLLHCTSNTAPLFTRIPLMITLHDIIYMEQSAWQIVKGKGTNYQKFGNVYRRLLVPRLINKAAKLTTVSDFERERIASFFGISNNQQLTTVYNGVSNYFKPVTDEDELLRVKNQYRLPDEFFFFLGNTHPKKNTPGTLKAFADYVRQSNSQVKLVMIDYNKNELEKLLQEIDCSWLMQRIVLTGYINNRDLPAIYSQAKLFLYPSLRESFGIPIIEAMACGVPVITSNTSSMPEVAGDAAVLADPFKPASITEAMLRICKDEEMQAELSAAGIKRAALFSWRSVAKQVLQLYYETAGVKYPAKNPISFTF